MTIRQWPKAERPREKLLEQGADVLSDAELLAVLLGSGVRGGSAVQLARELLLQFGSLRDLLTSDRARCLEQKGIGLARYTLMQAALELARRHYREALQLGSALAAPGALYTFLIAQLRDRPYEVFCCLHLDNQHRLLAFEELFRGSLDITTIHTREVVREALRRNAAAVILAHNHPSGCSLPSREDEIMTRQLRDALTLVKVRVVDHIIVGDNSCFSFAEHGLL